MSRAEAGVVDTGHFGNRCIDVAEEHPHGITHNDGLVSGSGHIYDRHTQPGSSDDLILHIAAIGYPENVAAVNQTVGFINTLVILTYSGPGSAQVSGQLHSTTHVGGEIEVRGIFQEVDTVKFRIPDFLCMGSMHRSDLKGVGIAGTDVDHNDALAVLAAGAEEAGIGGIAADLNGIVGNFQNDRTSADCCNIHPVTGFSAAGIACTFIRDRSHGDMLCTGNNVVMKIRLDHNVGCIGIDDLPACPEGAKPEGLTDRQPQIVLSVDIHQGAVLNSVCCGLRGFGILASLKGEYHILVGWGCKSRLCDLSFHRHTVSKG